MNEHKQEPEKMNHISCIPYDPRAFTYCKGILNENEYLPYTYTDWREETLSWKTSCYISANLSSIPFLKISGPDVIRLLSDISVNSFAHFPIGHCKHVIWCTETGNILFHGLALRTGEEEVKTYSDTFYLLYLIQSGKYNVKFEMSPPDSSDWVFQLAGPRCLEILEQAAREDLHDIEFMRFRNAVIAGHKIRILRMGMGGSLSYEVHGLTNEEGIDVYNEIMRVGMPYGIVKLGMNQYMCNHTENGYPQISIMFPAAVEEHEGYHEYLRKLIPNYDYIIRPVPRGSLSTNLKDYYRNPYELGWGHMVKFDHDFIGRAALEKIAANHRKMVTLVWNHEDIMKVFASFFEKGEEPYLDMPFPMELSRHGPAMKNCFQDRVLKDAKMIGVSMWRTYTLYYRETISLCCIDPEFAQIGTEVSVLWGDVGKRQLEIRAKVDRFPYLDLVPNKEFDVETIPHYKG